MRVAIIGASGRSGRAITTHALAAEHEVIAVVRDASRAPQGARPIEADVRDPAAMAAAITGSDAVITALGHVRGQDDPALLRDTAGALVAAMGAASVSRVVAVSAAGAFVAGDDPLSRFVAKPILGRLFFADDTRAMEAVFARSATDWTMLRPSRLINGTSGAGYRTGVDRAVWWHYSTRFDTVGRAAVDALARPEWVGHAVFVTG